MISLCFVLFSYAYNENNDEMPSVIELKDVHYEGDISVTEGWGRSNSTYTNITKADAEIVLEIMNNAKWSVLSNGKMGWNYSPSYSFRVGGIDCWISTNLVGNDEQNIWAIVSENESETIIEVLSSYFPKAE